MSTISKSLAKSYEKYGEEVPVEQRTRAFTKDEIGFASGSFEAYRTIHAKIERTRTGGKRLKVIPSAKAFLPKEHHEDRDARHAQQEEAIAAFYAKHAIDPRKPAPQLRKD